MLNGVVLDGAVKGAEWLCEKKSNDNDGKNNNKCISNALIPSMTRVRGSKNYNEALLQHIQ